MTKLYAYLIIIVLLVGGTWWGVDYVSGLQASVATLTHEKKDLSDALEAQNKAIIQLKKDSDDRLKKAQEDLAAAKKEADAKKTTATIIYKTQPSTPNDLCKSALDLMNGASK